MTDPDLLLRLYDAGQREYHFAVQLGAQRQTLYITLNAALLAGLAGSGQTGTLPALAYLGGACASLIGALIVRQSHQYYRNARAHLQRVEADLDLPARGLSLSTTPGMAGDTGGPRLRIVTAAIGTLLVFAALDILAAIVAWGIL